MISAPTPQIVRLHDRVAKLEGVIVIHSTALGPGIGGCRLWTYPNLDAAITDAIRLAEGMSYKNALAGLPFGGAKAVLRRPDGPFDRHVLFEAFGRAVERLEGRFVTAVDAGTMVADMEEVARVTRHVAGRRCHAGRAGGDPSPWTALGVFEAMRSAARLVLGAELEGCAVAVQGLGNVGARLCRRLADSGARLVIADLEPDRAKALGRELDARVVPAADIALASVDIFAPCALGGALTRKVVAAMKARLVCGGANNQLATSDTAAALVDNGIAYVPDYVANAGGIISVTAEYLGEVEASVATRVVAIGPRTASILEKALRWGHSPALVADRMAEEIMEAGSGGLQPRERLTRAARKQMSARHRIGH
jgi:leucine dehydrogenase